MSLKEEVIRVVKPLLTKRRAEMDKLVGIAVGLLISAVLLVPALNQIATTSTTGWNSAVATVFTTLLPILAVIGIALLFMPRFRK